MASTQPPIRLYRRGHHHLGKLSSSHAEIGFKAALFSFLPVSLHYQKRQLFDVADMSVATFGEHLPDQLPTIANAVAAHLWLEADVSSFLSERAVLEREYAGKLAGLTRKYRDKKVKKEQELIVGPTPTKEWTGQHATIAVFVENLLNASETTSSQHNGLAQGLDKISSEIAVSGKKREELRKKHTSYASKLLADRDKIYNDRQKAKSKYDELCHEVEAHRQKREKAEAGDKHVDRSAKAFENAQVDMWNGKNGYLIQIAISNRTKQKFYRENLPTVENSLQSLWTLTTQRIVSSMAKANSLVACHHELLATKYKQLDDEKQAVDAKNDQSTFIEYNQQRWQEPGDWAFEPCVGFFDSPEMSVESAPKVVLQNRLIRCKAKAADVVPLAESKQREVTGLENLRDAYEKQEGLGDPDDVMDNLFESTRAVIGLEIDLHSLYTEIDTIVAVIGDDQGQARPHRFKPASFTIPTSCDFCGGTIWGIAKQGFVCKPCGFTVHAKCEMKVSADCKAVPEGVGGGDSCSRDSMVGRSAGLDRMPSQTSTLGGGGGSRSSLGSSKPLTGYDATDSLSESVSNGAGNPVGRMLYGYEATSPFELGVSEGDMVELIEGDMDACGWVKVKKDGKQGLVPTSYCDFDTAANVSPASPPATEASVQGCGLFVRAIYDYAAQDSEEHSLIEGERVELTATGFDYGQGWCQGVKEGRVGIFPSNYVERE